MSATDNARLQPLSIKHIHLIKWTPDDTSTAKKIRIAETIAPKWREVAILIGLNHPQISCIESPGSGKTPRQCLDEVLRAWQDDRDGENQAGYLYNWTGLLKLLEDVECHVIAIDLREAISSQQNSMRENEMGNNPSNEPIQNSELLIAL